MASIEYPASLPAPQRWIGVPRERRAVSAIPGNTQHRNRSRDQVQDIEALWTYDAAQMAEWVEWFEETLVKGQRWFAVTILGPGGWIERVARFRTGTLRKEHVAFGVYRVSARLEQRGRSSVPFESFEVVVNVSAVANSNVLSAASVTLDPSAVYRVSLPAGQLYSGYSAWNSDSATGPGHPPPAGQYWGNYFWYQGDTPGIGSGTFGVSTTGYPNGEAARAAFVPGTLSGFTNYKFWISDENPSDNRGGVSVLLTRIA